MDWVSEVSNNVSGVDPPQNLPSKGVMKNEFQSMKI